MSETETLDRIKRLATSGSIRISRHAYHRAMQRGADEIDIRHALEKASTCIPSDDKWKVSGPDTDGDELTCIVALEGRVVVVTVY